MCTFRSLTCGLALLAIACSGSTDRDESHVVDAAVDTVADQDDADQAVDVGSDVPVEAPPEPTCPDSGPPPPIVECDPTDVNACPEGERCSIFPGGQSRGNCAVTFSQFGCVDLRTDPCGCPPGSQCGRTGHGLECMLWCKPAEATCPAGLVCKGDSAGYGHCQ